MHTAYTQGFNAGYAAAIAAVASKAAPQALDEKRVRQLLQLCHPDKHNGSVASNEATRWLLEQRPK